jgi:hypothetical protein
VRTMTRTRDTAFFALAAVTCLLVGRVLPMRLDALSPLKLTLVPIGIIAAIGIGWLSAVRPLAALTLAFALLGIVRVQPAPVDVVFAILIAATYAARHAQPRVPTFIAIPVALYTLVSILSMVNATDFHRAVIFEATTIYLIALGLWLSWAFTHELWVKVAMKTYIIVAAISGLLGPLALYLPFPGRSYLTFGTERAEGLFKDPNVYSAFLVPAAIILLEELTTPRLLNWRRSRLLLAFGLCSIGVVVAFSRAAWLNYGIAVTVLLVVQASRQGGLKRAVRSVSLLVVGGVAGLAVLYLSGSLTFLLQRSHLQSYDQARFANQSSAIDDMTRHVFGYGPGQSEVKLALSTHSYFARAAFEQGLIGFLTLTMILVGTLYCAYVLARRSLDIHGVGTAALLGIWLGQAVNCFFIDTMHWRHLWILAGLIWCGYAMLTGRQTAQPDHRVAPDL